MALRNHPLVVEALQLWWTTALRSMQSGGEQLEKTDYIVPARALQPERASLLPTLLGPSQVQGRQGRACGSGPCGKHDV